MTTTIQQEAEDNYVASEEEEEFWPTAPLLTGHRIHTIQFGGGCGDDGGSTTDRRTTNRVMRYKSMSSEAMTPLDMTYGGDNEDSGDGDNEYDEFYDGTGNLMWMAAICFGHLVAQRVEPLRSYLPSYLPSTTKTPRHRRNRRRRRRICELGCGTGGAGISLLLFSNNNDDKNNNDDGEEKNDNDNDQGCHVVFTDNDAESLELCRSNCELNDLDPNHYSHKLLGWGLQQQQQNEIENEGQKEEEQQPSQQCSVLERHSFDTVLATDVVYDLKMIAPLLQTVEFLLKPKKDKLGQEEYDNNEEDESGGQLILSHIPRFCIPKKEDNIGDDGDMNSSSSSNININDNGEEEPNQAFVELERFIQSEANKVGLSLVETIRPHQVLSEEDLVIHRPNDYNDEDNDNDSMQQLTLDSMKEAHAVVFIFQRSSLITDDLK